MDVQKFMDSRKKDLEDFEKQYNFLKTEYNTTLDAAIREQDPQQQQALITQVLQANASMVEEIRVILGRLNQGQNSFDPTTIDKLTSELIQYQKEYAEIEKTKDKVGTLKLIKASTSKKLGDATTMYYIYVAILIILCFIVAYLVLRTSWSTNIVQTITGAISPTQ